MRPVLNISIINTPLGSMAAIVDDFALYFLEFSDSKNFTEKLQRIEKRGYSVVAGYTEITAYVERELVSYFKGKIREFHTPLKFCGSAFQQTVMSQLRYIGYGQTCTYGELARAIDHPKASRAVALANRNNPVAIMVPCHRVIGVGGRLVGYSGGLDRKAWLLDFERQWFFA